MMTLRTLIQLVLILAFATAPLLQAAPVAIPVDADDAPAESAPASHAGHDHHAHTVGHAHSESSDKHAASHASHSDCHGGGEGGSCSSCVGCGIPLNSSSFLHAPAADYFVNARQWLEIDPESEQRPPKRIFS